MKKRILSLALALILLAVMALPVYAAQDTGFVTDDASLLSDSEVAALNTKLQSISSTYDVQILVITMNSINGNSPDWYIEYLYDTRDLGYGSNRDGVLLLVCMNIREYRILTNGLANEAIGKSGIEDIGNTIVPDLTSGNYADAFDKFADSCEYYLDGHINGFPFKWTKNLLISLGIGLIIGIVVALILKGQLKSVRRQNQANVYIKPGSMKLTHCSDFFLYRTVQRRRKTSSNSGSGSSRSSRSVGGGSF